MKKSFVLMSMVSGLLVSQMCFARGAAKPTSDCPDFSGNWKGACTVKSEGAADNQFDMPMVLEQQGCEAFTLNTTTTLRLGILNPSTAASSGGIAGRLTMLQWNDDRSALLYETSRAFYKRGVPMDPLSGMYVARGQVTLEKDNKLKAVESSETHKAECLFSKE